MSRLLAWAVPLAWAATMGGFGVSEWSARHQPVPPPTAMVTTDDLDIGRGWEEWLGIYYQGVKVGYLQRVLRTHSREGASGYTLRAATELVLPIMGRLQSVVVDGAAVFDAAHRLSSVVCMVHSATQSVTVSGHRGDEGLVIEVAAGETATPQRIVVPQEVQWPAFVLTPWRLAGLAPGQHWIEPGLDPVTMSRGDLQVEALRYEEMPWEGRLEQALVVRMTYQGLETLSWVLADGHLLREENSLGFLLVREPPEQARVIRRASSGVERDLLEIVAVPSNVLFHEPARVRRLQVVVSGLPMDRFQVVSPRQRRTPRRRGVLLDIEQEAVATGSGAARRPVDDPAMSPWLAPEPLIESDDAGIREVARACVGEEADAWQATQRLVRWVYEQVRKVPSIGVPSSAEVLRSRQGDCNEHTALFVAMARSLGIPTKICAGLVYHRGAFYYHAWPRVFVGRWVDVDPTLGQTVADATHIQLVEGGLDRQATIVQAIGRLRLAVVAYEVEEAEGR